MAYFKHTQFSLEYPQEIETEIYRIQCIIEEHAALSGRYPSRWLAIKLLEKDEDIRVRLRSLEGGGRVLDQAEQCLSHLESILDDDVDTLIASHRYGWINRVVHSVVKYPERSRLAFSDRVDTILTHKIFGIPVFLVAMWIVFKLTADVSAPYLEWLDAMITGPITRWIVGIITYLGLGDTWVVSMFSDGIIAGVGGVIVFVPVLTFLYLALAILEDTGYMARAAFVMDRVMNLIGLHGKSFLPMMLGFGCNVPAIYATRTLENQRDRILTGLLVPFMSCGARLPVYILFATIFFPDHSGLIIFSLYLIGVVTAILVGMLLQRTIFHGREKTPLLIELPEFRWPSWRNVWTYVQMRLRVFIKNAATVIMVSSLVIWVLMAIPVGDTGSFADVDVTESAFARISGAISPAFTPLGFGNWETSGALVTGFVAKEVVISTLAQTYGLAASDVTQEQNTFGHDLVYIGSSFIQATIDTLKSLPRIIGINTFAQDSDIGPTDLMTAIRIKFDLVSDGHGQLASLAFMVFVLMYTPCIAVIAAERHELGTRWMWMSIIGQTLLAWGFAFVLFQTGKFLGLG